MHDRLEMPLASLTGGGKACSSNTNQYPEMP